MNKVFANESEEDRRIRAKERVKYQDMKDNFEPTQKEIVVEHQPKQAKHSSLFHSAWNKKKLIAGVFIFLMLSSAFGFVVGTNMAYSVAYKEGALVGYTAALTDTANLLQQQGITLDWNRQADGAYKLVVHTPSGQTSQITVAANLIVEIRGADGKLKETARGAGTFTDTGKNWTIQQIGSVANVIGTESAPNATRMAYYLSESLTSAGIGTTSKILPSEITDHGLERAAATASTFISTGSWNCTKVKTVTTGTQAVVVWGLNFTPYADTNTSGNSLVAYDTTPGTKNLAVGDTETETWTITLT
jgi:hypothetical protein